MSIDAETFRRVLAAAPTAVTVLTLVDASGVDHGMTVSSFASLSLEPPLVLVCVGDDATIADAMRDARTFGISVLAEHQADLSIRFADRDVRGFDGVACTRGPSGTALLDGAVVQLECHVVARHPGGDHTIVVGEVRHAVAHDHRPLVHLRGRYRSVAP